METLHEPSHVFVQALAPRLLLLLHVEVEVAERLSLTQILRFLRQTDGSSLAPRAASAVSPSPSIWTASSRPEGYLRISAVYTITSTQLNNSFANQAHMFSTIAFSVWSSSENTGSSGI